MESKTINKNSDDRRNSNKNDIMKRNSSLSKLDEEGNEDFDNDKIKKVFEKVNQKIKNLKKKAKFFDNLSRKPRNFEII